MGKNEDKGRSVQERITRLRGRVREIPTYEHPEAKKLVATLQGILDLLEDEL